MRALTEAQAREITPLVWSIVRRRFATVPDHVASPDDLYQYGMEGAAKAARRFDRRGGASFKSWTTTAAHRAIQDALRSLTPGARTDSPFVFTPREPEHAVWATLEDDRVDIDADLVNRALATAIGELPKRQRDALLLRYGLDLTHAQVAERMGGSEGTASAHLSIALSKLRRDPALAGLG